MRGLGPKEIIKTFIAIAFIFFLIKNQKPPQLGISHCTSLARLVWVYRKLHSFGILSPISINFFFKFVKNEASDLKVFHFIAIAFIVFLTKNQKPGQLGFSHCTLLASAAMGI